MNFFFLNFSECWIETFVSNCGGLFDVDGKAQIDRRSFDVKMFIMTQILEMRLLCGISRRIKLECVLYYSLPGAFIKITLCHKQQSKKCREKSDSTVSKISYFHEFCFHETGSCFLFIKHASRQTIIRWFAGQKHDSDGNACNFFLPFFFLSFIWCKLLCQAIVTFRIV